MVKGNFKAFREIVNLLTKHKYLTWEMAKREITERYKGQILGSFWAVLHPLVLIIVYVFIFVFVFKIKMGGTREMPLDYTTYLLAGLIPWLSFQEAMMKASTVIIVNANIVKQVVFPVEILPVKGVISSLITQVIFFLMLIVYVGISYHSLHWTYVFLPLLIFVQALGMIGVSYILAAVGAYFRDVKDFVQVFSFIGVYLLPIFYLPEQLPELFKPLIYLNPFSYLIWCYQDVLYLGRFENPWSWLIFIVLSHAVFIIGYRLFRKLKVMFGNVI